MSKSSTLKVKSLFKLKSPEKEKKERKPSGSLGDGDPGDKNRTLPVSVRPSSPGDDATFPDNVLPTSPKEKKKRRLLPFKVRRRKSKSKEDDVFPDTDELDSFSSSL